LKVFIDTSAFCALTIPKDIHNQRAKAIYKQLPKAKTTFYTSDYVLDEVYTLLKKRGNHATAIKFMDSISKSNLIVLRVSENTEEAAKTIFRRNDDTRLSFTDCTSFALINEYNLDAVFAFDNHFVYYPFKHPVQVFGLTQ
jgi:hypothetical protein